ncbi:MAG TPA: TonB-dependent receptor [Sunxiuqinia sp.]|nr:TonB-dependent receptor [Sunxiuqinia sp.]
MKHSFLFLAMSVLCFFASLPAFSQTSKNQVTSNLQDTIIAVEAVTVHAFHYESRLQNTPGSIAIISPSQLQQNTMHPINTVLNQVPGVYMQSGSLNTNRLTIRGVGSRSPYASNKIRAYFAGIPLTNGVGETTVEDLNQSVLSKVEVIKGPASGFYGSGLGGTLLFEAVHPTQSWLSANYGAASYQTDQFNGEVALAGKKNSNLLAIEKLNSDGYRENNQTDRFNLNYVGHYEFASNEINIIVNHTELMAYIPSSLDLQTYTNSPEKAASSWAETKGYENYGKNLVGASIKSHWGNNWQSTIALFGQNRNSKELRPFNLLKENSRYGGGRFVFEKKIEGPKANWKFTLGNESFFEKYDWSTFENGNRQQGAQLSDNLEHRNYFNVFGQADYQPSNKLKFSAGANINQTAYHYTDLFLADGDQSGNYTFKLIVSPRLAFNYSLTKRHSIYAQVSHGFSPPSLEETLMPDGSRNPNIQPETGWNFEVGSRGYLFERFYYDLSAYYMRIRNLLVARRVGEDAYMGINSGQTAHPGVEYFMQYRWPASGNWKNKLSFNGSFTPYYFVHFLDGETDYSGNELTGVPRHTNNLSYQLSWKQTITFQMRYRHVGRMPLRDDNSVYSDAYSLLSANLQYEKGMGRFRLKTILTGNNLTNEHYSSMVLINANSFGGNAPRYYYPGMPINFGLQVKLTYLI